MSLSTNLISGLSSGFDWRSMIDQLIAVEHRRVDILEGRKGEYEEKLSAWQSFNTTLLSLKTSAAGLSDPDDFYLYTAGMTTDSSTVEGEDLLSVSTDTTAAPGIYSIKVTNLAQAQKLSSNPFTSLTAELGNSYAGDIIINGKVIAINATDTLNDVANSINSANTGIDPSGVTAGIINYGTSDYRILLTSNDTGEDGISILNGSQTNLAQKFGWKDNQTPVLKNSITNGGQSDRFATHNVSIKSLLGLPTGEASTGTLTVDGTAVTINLSTDSLTDIKDAINTAMVSAGKGDQVVASVISEPVDGTTCYRLQIEGTQTFVDENNILNTLGVLDHTSTDVTGKVSGNAMTTDGAYISPDTLLVDIDGYISYTSGDKITMTGTDTSNGAVNHDFNISSSTTVSDLLNEIEAQYGDVIAYVTSDGKIRADDIAGSEHLDVTLTDNITNGELEFVDGNVAFGAASTRKREVVAGEDATVEIDGVEITDSSNIIDDIITGVTLNLVSEDSSTTVTLKVEHDIDTIKSNVQDFVSKYNETMSYINAQFSYDDDAEETGGVLFGDGTLLSVKSDLTSLLTENVWGVDSDFSILGMVGINMDNDLLLNIDDSKLTGYLQTNFNDIMSLFTGQGTSSSSNLSYIDHSNDTEAGQYTVHINRAATQGTENGNVNLSSGGVDETLTITQGDNSAEITLTNGMSLNDIINEINTELDTNYTQAVVGDEDLYSDAAHSIAITSETKWNSIYDSTGTALSFSDSDIISFSGTSRNGIEISGNYTINAADTDTVQELLSAIEDAFSSNVTATIDTSGRIAVTDEYGGTSQLAINSISHPTESQFFGTVDVTSGAGDGSKEGRWAMTITATDDGSNHLVLGNDAYGSKSFTISQDTSDNNYDHIIYTETGNTTESTSGNVFITDSTTWDDVYGAGVTNGDTITISGKARDGSTDISGTCTISDTASDTINGLLTDIETAYAAQGTTVDALVRDGIVYVEDTTAGSSSIALTLTCNNEGGGNLSLGVYDQTTERDLDLGLTNGTFTGLDVAGTIGGEAATGSDQILTGNDGETNVDGLTVKYTGTNNDVDAGDITVTIGVAELFDRTLDNVTDQYDGYVAFKQDSLQDSIDDFGTRIEQTETFLDRKMETMINRFVAMEMVMNKIQNQSDWLAGQLNASYSAWHW
jgi:flagellar hook-associated protein 2